MKPVSPVLDETFDEVEIAKNQPEFRTVPAIITAEGGIYTRWELSDEDIEKIKETRSIYYTQWTGGGLMQPVNLSTDKPELVNLLNPKLG